MPGPDDERLLIRLRAFAALTADALTEDEVSVERTLGEMSDAMNAALGWPPPGHMYWLKKQSVDGILVPKDGKVRLAAAAAAARETEAKLANRAAKRIEKAQKQEEREAKAAQRLQELAARKARAEAAKQEREEAPPPLKSYRRINQMGGPLGKDETDDSGPTTMMRSDKIGRCKTVIANIHGAISKLFQEWRVEGSDVNNPPFVSNSSGGSEIGGKKGKPHLQLTFEVWDLASLSDDTVRAHLKAWVQPIVDATLI